MEKRFERVLQLWEARKLETTCGVEKNGFVCVFTVVSVLNRVTSLHLLESQFLVFKLSNTKDSINKFR